jgi:hypothetical protein
VLDCELSHGVFVPDLRLVLGQNGCASRSNQNPSLQLSGLTLNLDPVKPEFKPYFYQLSNTFLLLFSSDPWMGLGPGSLPGVSPLSCASSSLDPAQKTAQVQPNSSLPIWFCFVFAGIV